MDEPEDEVEAAHGEAIDARTTIAMRAAADYMQANGMQQASWDQIHAWAAKKGSA